MLYNQYKVTLDTIPKLHYHYIYMDNECDLVILVIIIYLYIILYYTFLPFIPNIPFNHPALLYFTSPHLCTVPSLSYTHPLSCFLSPSATDQGEAICSSNPSLILTQRS